MLDLCLVIGRCENPVGGPRTRRGISTSVASRSRSEGPQRCGAQASAEGDRGSLAPPGAEGRGRQGSRRSRRGHRSRRSSSDLPSAVSRCNGWQDGPEEESDGFPEPPRDVATRGVGREDLPTARPGVAWWVAHRWASWEARMPMPPPAISGGEVAGGSRGARWRHRGSPPSPSVGRLRLDRLRHLRVCVSPTDLAITNGWMPESVGRPPPVHGLPQGLSRPSAAGPACR
jgi:hypothetical protein